MKGTRQRKFIIIILIVAAVLITSTTFAYWATYIEGTSDETSNSITVGTAKSVKTVITINDANQTPYGQLVPVGQAINSGSQAVEMMTFNFDINWAEQQETIQTSGDILQGLVNSKISYEIISDQTQEILNINEYKAVYDLITIEASPSNYKTIKLNDTSSSLYQFTVKMSEPANKSHYELIQNSKIIIHFNFIVEPITDQTKTYGNDFIELGEYLGSLLTDYYETNGRYPRGYSDYAYTDIGLVVDEWTDPLYHFTYTPRGNRINLEIEDGYSLSVTKYNGEIVSLNSNYNWNIVYSPDNDSWYFRSIDQENLIDISTLEIDFIK